MTASATASGDEQAMAPTGGTAAKPPLPTTEIHYPSQADGTLQPARFHRPEGDTPVPLVVGLHTWSGDYRQRQMPRVEEWCAAQGWVAIHPDFRGPARRPEATGSDLVVADILAAVDYAKENAAVDPSRIYLLGASGGGYHALLLAARAPAVWAGVSAWVPIADLAAWHRECTARGLGYARQIALSCGGVPGSSPEVDEQYRRRSPLTWLKPPLPFPVDINAGIHDGHTGSVPISHSLLAFNALAAPSDRIAPADIQAMTQDAAVPPHLHDPELSDPSYGARAPLFRRTSGSVRLTIFKGGHDQVESAIIAWLQEQSRRAPVAGAGSDAPPR